MKTWTLICFLPLYLIGVEPTLSHVITPRGEINPLVENKKLITQFYDAFMNSQVDIINDLLAKNYAVQDSTVVFDSTYSKYDAFSKNMLVRMKSLHTALPDFRIDIIQMLAEGNQVLARVQISGVQRGPFLGIEPTLKPVIIKMFTLFTIEHGKISHINEVWNELGVMKQIGYIAF